MSYIKKEGKLIGIGRNVKFTHVKSELKDKRSVLFHDTQINRLIEQNDSKLFLYTARKDPVTFTYSVWRLFKEDSEKAILDLSNLTLNADAKEVIKALEIMLIDASKKINAFCLGYIISQINMYIDLNPYIVKKALKKLIFADFFTAVRIMKEMYDTSEKTTKEIAKKLMSPAQLKLVKTFIKPMIRKNR